MTSFTVGTPYIMTARSNRDNWSSQWTLGNHFNVTPNPGPQARAYNGLMGEVIAYDRGLSVPEQQSVEAYLNRKWFGTKTAENNIIPPTVALELASGAALDLGQTQQSFVGLSGSGGSVTNGTTTLGGTLEVTVGPNGAVTPFYFSTLILSDGLKIVFKGGFPANGSVILQGSSVTGNVSTFTVPTGLSVRLANNKLSVYRSGTIFFLR